MPDNLVIMADLGRNVSMQSALQMVLASGPTQFYKQLDWQPTRALHGWQQTSAVCMPCSCSVVLHAPRGSRSKLMQPVAPFDWVFRDVSQIRSNVPKTGFKHRRGEHGTPVVHLLTDVALRAAPPSRPSHVGVPSNPDCRLIALRHRVELSNQRPITLCVPSWLQPCCPQCEPACRGAC